MAQDVRDCEGFCQSLVAYIKKGLSAGEMYDQLRRDYPDALIPSSRNSVNQWLNTKPIWRRIRAQIGDDKDTKILYELFRRTASSTGSAKSTISFEEMTAPPTPSAVLHTRHTRARKFG